MTSEILIEHVQQSIDKALRHESWIDESVLSVGGFSSGVIRRLFSNLVHLPKSDPVYLECGLFRGGTICAVMNNSPTLTVYGVEDFSQPFGQDGVRENLERNVATYRAGAHSVTIIDGDCFTIDLAQIKRAVDVFFYDAIHSYEAQRDAITRFLPLLAQVSILVVDDFSWESVKTATREALRLIADKAVVEREWVLGNGQPDQPAWHNDVAVFVLRKL